MKAEKYSSPPVSRLLGVHKATGQLLLDDNRPEARRQADCIRAIHTGTRLAFPLPGEAEEPILRRPRTATALPATEGLRPPRQFKRGTASSSAVIQRAVLEVTITGITHLVRPIAGSIFGGEETLEVDDGTIIRIDTDRSIWSRRGPNQEVDENRIADREGPQIYEWYPVRSIDGRPAPENSYLRDETFVAPGELTISEGMKDEGQGAIDRAKSKDQSSKTRPTEPDYTKIPSDKQDVIKRKYQEKLTKWQEKNHPKSLQELLLIVFQSIGTTFEEAAENFVVRKHPGCIIYAGLKTDSQHELDFVVIQGEDVLIYSAKLDSDKVDPPTDRAHWEAIKSRWAAGGKEIVKGKELSGPLPDAPPANAPLILGISPQTFGLNGSEEFLSLLVPNWEQQLTPPHA